MGMCGYNSALFPGRVLTLEEERHLAAFRSIIAKKGSLKQAIMHCLFLGYPGGGKTSLIRRLTAQPPSPTLPSTGVAEKALLVKVCRTFTSTVHCSWGDGAGSTWTILSYDDEAIALMATANATPTSTDESVEETGNQSVLTDSFDSYTCTLSPQIEVSTAETPFTASLEVAIEAPSIQNQPAVPAPSLQADTLPMNILMQAIKHNGLEKVQRYLQQSFLLYLTDTGGQLEFQELLPALNAGPTLFFIVFRLDQGLDEIVNIQFRFHDGSSSEPYQSSVTVKESLFQSLASIASMGSYMYGKEEELVSLKPKVIFVGTHRDKVSTQKIQQIDKSLQEMVKMTSFYPSGHIEFASASQLVVAVNNLSPDDSDFQQLRSIVKRIADRPGHSYEVNLPSTWLIFSLTIRQLKKHVLTYEECFDIGQQCGIESQEQLNEALWFLSTKVGLVRHFRGKGLEDLEKIVIVDPQILFDKITKLIVSTFTVCNTTPDVCEEFKSKGIFPLSVLQRICSDDDLLTVSRFVTLLEHLHIISRLHTEEVKYFIPCTLAHAQSTAPEFIPSSNDMPSTQQIPSLLFTFKCGYCPMGLFSTLVVYLLGNKMNSELNWELQTESIFSKVISFCVGPYDTVTLIVTPKHIEISLHPVEIGRKRRLSVGAICTELKRCVQMAIEEVTSTLHYTNDAEHSLAFYCMCRHVLGLEQHPAKINFHGIDPCSLLCNMGGTKCNKELPNGYNYWFSDVSPPK